MPGRLSRIASVSEDLGRFQDQALQVLNSALAQDALQADGDWVLIGDPGAPSFLPGWSNFDAVNWQRARYRADRFGCVELQGLVVGTPSATAYVTCLPDGCRPGKALIFPALSNNAGTATIGDLRVLADGRVLAASGGATWFSLSGVRFKAEA